MNSAVGRRMWGPGSMRGVHAVAEALASRDLNNLYRTSCYFWEVERYQAFCASYAVMRIVDDHVDALLARKSIPSAERLEASKVVTAWDRLVSSCLAGRPTTERDAVQTKHAQVDELVAALTFALQRFPVSAALWRNFFAAMRQDLERDGPWDFSQFVKYAEGAAVAPTTIYLNLIVAEQGMDGGPYEPPRHFALLEAGRELGLFAYLAHILRDLRKDLVARRCGELYLGADDMAAHGVTEAMLLSDLVAERASTPVRALVGELAERAGRLAVAGRSRLGALDETLSPDRRFVLELIVRVYEEILRKIIRCSCDVMGGEHELTEDEKKRIAIEVLAELELLR